MGVVGINRSWLQVDQGRRHWWATGLGLSCWCTHPWGGQALDCPLDGAWKVRIHSRGTKDLEVELNSDVVAIRGMHAGGEVLYILGLSLLGWQGEK